MKGQRRTVHDAAPNRWQHFQASRQSRGIFRRPKIQILQGRPTRNRRCSFDSLLPERIVNEPALFEEKSPLALMGRKVAAEKALVFFIPLQADKF